MRWNSTKTYTEQDMMRMQQEAVNRVHEFQTRAQQMTPYYDVPESALRPVLSDHGMMPTHLPTPALTVHTGSAPAVPPLTVSSVPEEPDTLFEQLPVLEAEAPPDPEAVSTVQSVAADPLHAILSALNVDNEVLLIAGLIFLLYNEHADGTLLLALAYLLL